MMSYEQLNKNVEKEWSAFRNFKLYSKCTAWVIKHIFMFLPIIYLYHLKGWELESSRASFRKILYLYYVFPRAAVNGKAFYKSLQFYFHSFISNFFNWEECKQTDIHYNSQKGTFQKYFLTALFHKIIDQGLKYSKIY